MGGADGSTVLERKIGAHRPRAAVPSGPEQILFTAFSRIAEQRLSLPLGLVSASFGERTPPEIADTLPDQALIALLDGPGDATGAAILDPGGLSALIESMTLGEVGPTAAPPRRPTRTDAAMVSGLIDALLGLFDSLIASDPAAVWTQGFRYGSHLPDPRPLGVLLDDPSYRVLRLDLTFGPGNGRSGSLSLILPARGRGRAAAPDGAATGAAPDAVAAAGSPAQEAEAFGAALHRAVHAVQAEISATLARVTLPLADFLMLEAGQSLTLPAEALRTVLVEGADGQLLCLARLGQGGGQRALRLDFADAEEAAPPIAPPVAPAEIVTPADQPLQVAPASGIRENRTATADAPLHTPAATTATADTSAEVDHDPAAQPVPLSRSA